MTNIKHFDLSAGDMIMILGALLAIKEAIPDGLEVHPEAVQLQAAKLLHLIQRFREALGMSDDDWRELSQMFALATVEAGQPN